MSLVAYGSSDESNDEEEVSESVDTVANLINKTRTVLSLPAPKDPFVRISTSQHAVENIKPNNSEHGISETDESTLFKNLPKPKHIEIDPTEERDDDVIIHLEKDAKISQEKAPRKNRAPVKISLPSLSEFKDVDEEREERKKNRVKPSEKGTGLFSILPPPKGSSTKATIRSLIPDAVKKVQRPKQVEHIRPVKIPVSATNKTNPLASINYDSDSDEDSRDETKRKLEEGNVDFFSLENNDKISLNVENSGKDFFSLVEEPQIISKNFIPGDNNSQIYKGTRIENVSQPFQIIDRKVGTTESEEIGFGTSMEFKNAEEEENKGGEVSEKILTSNVINLPKEEIRMKNMAEVGPKLPIPEQEYNVDSQGNVAFDEKAIEYLCGRRGVKRKNKDFDAANIIEINGEDIKPDEREWLVKALTEEAADRPVSMESAGPSTQSRKKHQITYLAHQAKAMEVELKNQWAQNRVTRKQTQSKYGF